MLALKCPNCQTEKNVSEFHKDKSSPSGFAYYCKVCANIKGRLWYLNNKENSTFKEKRRNYYYQKNYKFTLIELEEILKSQEYKCLICSCELSLNNKNTHLDHNHTTHRIRGFLCTNCNRGLGHFKENPIFLARAIEYLNEDKVLC